MLTGTAQPPALLNGAFPTPPVGAFAGFAFGTFAAPGAYFTAEPTLGFYRSSAGVITATGVLALAANAGTPRVLSFDSATLGRRWAVYADGSAESGGNAGSNFFIARYTDAGAFNGNPVSIIRSTGAVSLSNTLSASGAVRVLGGVFTTRIRQDNSIIDFVNSAESLYTSGRVQGTTLELFGNSGTGITVNASGLCNFVDGSAASPAITFLADQDTGISRQGANSMALCAGAAQVALVQTAAMVGGDGTNGCWYLTRSPGSAAAPCFSFIGDTDTGILSSGANEIAFSAGGFNRVFINTNGLTINSGRVLRLGNAYVAGAPGAATGTVTLQDSAGTTYRVPVLV